jgi:hypothetical protein
MARGVKNWIVVVKDGKYLAVEDTHNGEEELCKSQNMQIAGFVNAKTASDAINTAIAFCYVEGVN